MLGLCTHVENLNAVKYLTSSGGLLQIKISKFFSVCLLVGWFGVLVVLIVLVVVVVLLFKLSQTVHLETEL